MVWETRAWPFLLFAGYLLRAIFALELIRLAECQIHICSLRLSCPILHPPPMSFTDHTSHLTSFNPNEVSVSASRRICMDSAKLYGIESSGCQVFHGINHFILSTSKLSLHSVIYKHSEHQEFKYEQLVQDCFPKWPAEFWIQKKSLRTKYESETSTVTCTSVHITLS